MLGRDAGMPVSTCGKGLELCMLCFHYQKERTDKVSMTASAVPRGVNLRAPGSSKGARLWDGLVLGGTRCPCLSYQGPTPWGKEGRWPTHAHKCCSLSTRNMQVASNRSHTPCQFLAISKGRSISTKYHFM